MAEKRMFTKKIIDGDAFLDMPLSTQALYFHLAMRADDEGFINNPKKIMRMIGASEDELKVLFAKRFVLAFESGVIVIKHWKMHNCIRADRLKPTAHRDERDSLLVKQNGAYTECQTSVRQVTDTCPHRLDKIRLEETSIEEVEFVDELFENKETTNQTKEKSTPDYEQLFDVFYSAFPKHTEKKPARKRLIDILSKSKDSEAKFSEIMEGVKKYKKNCLDNKTKLKYIKNPSSWLLNERWEDEYEEEKESFGGYNIL